MAYIKLNANKLDMFFLHEKIIRQAFQKRLFEIRPKLTEMQYKDDFALSNNLNDPEEILRIVMVKLWPKAESNSLSIEEKKTFFKLIFRLFEPAQSKDFRYLDAWNNVYEVLVKYSWHDETLLIPFAAHFYQLYYKLLEFQLT